MFVIDTTILKTSFTLTLHLFLTLCLNIKLNLILVKPKVTSVKQIPKYVYVNDSVTLSCGIEQPCVPECSYLWYKFGSVKNESFSRNWKIQRATRDHEGTYYCVAYNSVGEDKYSGSLTIACKSHYVYLSFVLFLLYLLDVTKDLYWDGHRICYKINKIDHTCVDCIEPTSVSRPKWSIILKDDITSILYSQFSHLTSVVPLVPLLSKIMNDYTIFSVHIIAHQVEQMHTKKIKVSIKYHVKHLQNRFFFT